MKVIGNNFNNNCSEFVPHTTLNTSANLQRPYYAQISIATNGYEEKLIAVKTSSSIIVVKFDKITFVDHKKLIFGDDRLDRSTPISFTFKDILYTGNNMPDLVIGYRSGLVAVINPKDRKILNFLNYDDKKMECIKKAAPNLIISMPGTKNDEILVLYSDSTIMRYNTKNKGLNQLFQEKLKTFEEKKKFNFGRKTIGPFTFGSVYNDNNPEFNMLFARNTDEINMNPLEFIKFECKTISDINVVQHKSFGEIFKRKEEFLVLALVTYNGYFLMYDYSRMESLFSFKSKFGGFSTFTFNNNYQLVALSGHDDCITVIDLITFGFFKCEGHKSFLSKVIFQTIPSKKTKDYDELSHEKEKILENSNFAGKIQPKDEYNYNRIIAGSLDSNVSIWEFEKDFFNTHKYSNIVNTKTLPVSINSQKYKKINILQAISWFKMKDAVGWIEIVDELLIINTFDGYISTYMIKDLPLLIVLPEEQEKQQKLLEQDKILITSNLITQEQEDTDAQNQLFSNLKVCPGNVDYIDEKDEAKSSDDKQNEDDNSKENSENNEKDQKEQKEQEDQKEKEQNEDDNSKENSENNEKEQKAQEQREQREQKEQKEKREQQEQKDEGNYPLENNQSDSEHNEASQNLN